MLLLYSNKFMIIQIMNKNYLKTLGKLMIIKVKVILGGQIK